MGIERPKGTECSRRHKYKWRRPRKSRARTHYERNTKWSGKHRQLPASGLSTFLTPFLASGLPLPHPPTIPSRPVPPVRRSHCNWTWKFRRSCWFDTLSYSHSIKFAEDGAAESAAIGGFYLELAEKCEKIPGARPAEMRMRSILGTLSRRSAGNSPRNVFTMDSRSDFI